jgi:hypothetical protein
LVAAPTIYGGFRWRRHAKRYDRTLRLNAGKHPLLIRIPHVVLGQIGPFTNFGLAVHVVTFPRPDENRIAILLLDMPARTSVFNDLDITIQALRRSPRALVSVYLGHLRNRVEGLVLEYSVLFDSPPLIRVVAAVWIGQVQLVAVLSAIEIQQRPLCWMVNVPSNMDLLLSK